MEVKNPVLHAYNSANAFPGEAAENPLDVRFSLTTRLPDMTSYDADGGSIIIVPPVGKLFDDPV